MNLIAYHMNSKILVENLDELKFAYDTKKACYTDGHKNIQ